MTANNKKFDYKFEVGMKYGSSTLKEITTDKVHKYLHLICDCGTEFTQEIHMFYIKKYKMCKSCYRIKHRAVSPDNFVDVTKNKDSRYNEYKKLLGTSQFGSLIPIKVLKYKKQKNNNDYNTIYFQCLCVNCGNDKYNIKAHRLTDTYHEYKSKYKSCGCVNKRKSYKRNITSHGLSNTSVYKYWKLLVSQCKRKIHPFSVSKEWENSLENFISDISLLEYEIYHKHYTLVPVDLNKPISKNNYTWHIKHDYNSPMKYLRWKNHNITTYSNYFLGNN